jgi:hypothetical protein
MDAALHLAAVTGLLVKAGSASTVAIQARAHLVHLSKPVASLGHVPVAGSLEQDGRIRSILENAVSPEDPVREIVASREIPVIAGLA